MVFPDKKDLIRKSLCSIGILSLFFFVSCKDDDAVEEMKSETTQDKKEEAPINYRALFSTNHKICEEEAKGIALDVASLLEGEDNGLKSGKARVVEDVRVLHSERTSLRSGSSAEVSIPDTLAYVFNFAEGDGFAIISADDRLDCPVLACAESGSIGDDTDNPGLAIFLENAQVYMSRCILKFEVEKDSMMEVAKQKLALEDSVPSNVLRRTFTGRYTYQTAKAVGPLLRTKWGQDAPYNRYTPLCSVNGNNTPTGCCATAMAQVMAYHRFPPLSFKDEINSSITLNWSSMTAVPHAGKLSNETAKDMIARLMRFIGKTAGMQYECEESKLSTSKSITFMRSMAYKCGLIDYNFSSAMSLLDKKNPFLMQGAAYVQEGGNTERKGHFWVVDGYSINVVEQYQYVTNTETGKTITRRLSIDYKNSFLHVNWGWSGIGDGYFVAGCFDPIRAVQFDDFGVDVYDFKYELMMISASPLQ